MADWFYRIDGGEKQGPISPKELVRLAESGALSPDDLVRKEGTDKWVRASQIKGLTFLHPSPDVVSDPPEDDDGVFAEEYAEEDFDEMPAQLSTPAETPRRVTTPPRHSTKSFSFLDMNFDRFFSPMLVRIIWVMWLVLGFLAAVLLVLEWAYSLTDKDSHGGLWALILFTLPIQTIAVRVVLENVMIRFVIADHLQQINDKLSR